MKITTTERTVTRTIDASASELRESNTLGQNFAMMLSRVFQNKEPLEDMDDDEDGEQEDKDS